MMTVLQRPYITFYDIVSETTDVSLYWSKWYKTELQYVLAQGKVILNWVKFYFQPFIFCRFFIMILHGNHFFGSLFE